MRRRRKRRRWWGGWSSQVCDPVGSWLGMCWKSLSARGGKGERERKKNSFPWDESEVEPLTVKKFLHVSCHGDEKNDIWGWNEGIQTSFLSSSSRVIKMETQNPTSATKEILQSKLLSASGAQSVSTDSNLLVHFPSSSPPPLHPFASYLHQIFPCLISPLSEVLNMLHNALCRKNGEWVTEWVSKQASEWAIEVVLLFVSDFKKVILKKIILYRLVVKHRS